MSNFKKLVVVFASVAVLNTPLGSLAIPLPITINSDFQNGNQVASYTYVEHNNSSGGQSSCSANYKASYNPGWGFLSTAMPATNVEAAPCFDNWNFTVTTESPSITYEITRGAACQIDTRTDTGDQPLTATQINIYFTATGVQLKDQNQNPYCAELPWDSIN